jgi:hypothetical protein
MIHFIKKFNLVWWSGIIPRNGRTNRLRESEREEFIVKE